MKTIKLNVRTGKHTQMLDITQEIQQAVTQTGTTTWKETPPPT